MSLNLLWYFLYAIANPRGVQEESCLSLQRRLGQRIRELRREAGLSQEAFADQCVVHRVHMGKIEQGNVGPSICILGRIARGLKISISELVRDIDTESPTGSAAP